MEQRRQLARRSRSLLAPFLIALSVVCLVGSTRVQAYCFEEQRHTSAAGNNLWPGGVIPYIWDPSDPPTAQQRQRVLAVMAEFESASAGILKFLPRTNEAHYAKIIRGSKCAPGARDRAQTVVVSHIGNDGCAGWTLRHEMGHLVGLSHHAQRRDRDRYLIVAPGVPGAYGGPQCDPNDPSPMQHGVLSKFSMRRPFAWGDSKLVEDANFRGFGTFDFDSVMLYGGGGPLTNNYQSPNCGVFPSGDRSYVRRGSVDVAPNPPCESDVRRSSPNLSLGVRSTLVELYRTLNGWAPFHRIGFDRTSREPRYVLLARGVRPVGTPAIVSLGLSPTPSRPVVMTLARGDDSRVYERRAAQAQLGSTWSALPGTVASDPAAVSWSQSESRIDVVAISGSDVVKIAYHDGGWESGWTSIGAPGVGVSQDSGPAVASWGVNRLDVFVRGNDDHVWQKSWLGTSWSDWSRPRATNSGRVQLSTRPAAVSWDEGRIDLVIRGLDGGLYHLPFFNGIWSPTWFRIGNPGASGVGSPAIASWGPNRLDVFVRGGAGNHHLWQLACTTGNCASLSHWPGSFNALGGVLASDPSASAARKSPIPRIDVVARHIDDNIDPWGNVVPDGVWHKWWPWDSWPVLAQARKADFDGDRKTDMSVWRGSSGNWWVRNSTTGEIQPGVTIGQAGDIPVPGDYDGDGKTDMAVWRISSGNWWFRAASIGVVFPGVEVGKSGDIPVPGDYDGDGRTDMAVFRPSDGTWHIRESSTGRFAQPITMGQFNDAPVPADYDGDGRVDLAVYRSGDPGTWWVRPSTTLTISPGVEIGSGDIPLPADFDGDGKADMSVWRPSSGNWWVRTSRNNQIQSGVQFGQSHFRPVPGDYDGDGKADMAMWDPWTGNWTYLASSTGITHSYHIGQSGDVPVVRNAAPSTHRSGVDAQAPP